MQPAQKDPLLTLVVKVEQTKFINNKATTDAIFVTHTNSDLQVYKSEFMNTSSQGRGSVLYADYQKAKSSFKDCIFKNNYAYHGGVFYVQHQSVATVNNCTITNNFAVKGGVAYINNDGAIVFTNNTIVTHNSALNTCFLFLINSALTSEIQQTQVAFNDQNQALIDKKEFMKFDATGSGTISFLTNDFVKAMQDLGSLVNSAIVDKTDPSIYCVKSHLKVSA